MHQTIIRRWALSLFAAAALPAAAAPMGFKHSTMAMGDFGSNWREAYANYALTARDAIGVSATWMRSDDHVIVREVDELTYTRLLGRWNLPHAQANVWFIGGLGVLHRDGQRRTMATPGVQVDYETTRIYLAATQRLYRAEGIRHDFSSLRAGFSFYEAAYDATQPWLIFEARRMQGLSERTEITPMLRLINKSYFIEAGINTERQARFNFMTIF
ncbi:MAG TPA: hypothetical protein VGC21_02180 [Telluria sp.]|jgi:hypothetical protein